MKWSIFNFNKDFLIFVGADLQGDEAAGDEPSGGRKADRAQDGPAPRPRLARGRSPPDNLIVYYY